MQLQNKVFIILLHSTFGNLQCVSGTWNNSVKWNMITVPHFIQKDSVSCEVLTMRVCTNSNSYSLCMMLFCYVYAQFAKAIIMLNEPLPTSVKNLYRLQNEMVVELLKISGSMHKLRIYVQVAMHIHIFSYFMCVLYLWCGYACSQHQPSNTCILCIAT